MTDKLELTDAEILERFCQIWDTLILLIDLTRAQNETTNFLIKEVFKLGVAHIKSTNKTSLSRLNKRIDGLAEELEGLTIHYSSTLKEIKKQPIKKRGRYID